MNRKVFYLDLLERTGWTFVQGWAASWLLLEGAAIDELFAIGNIKVAAGAGVLAIAKSLVAQTVGDRNSAATLGSPPDYAGPLNKE